MTSQDNRLNNRLILEQLSHRLEYICGHDRELLKLYIESGVSIRQIAVLLGISETRVSRKIDRMMQRLCSREYELLMLTRRKLSTEQFSLAVQYYIQGISTRKLAEVHKATRYSIRSRLQKIRAHMFRMENMIKNDCIQRASTERYNRRARAC